MTYHARPMRRLLPIALILFTFCSSPPPPLTAPESVPAPAPASEQRATGSVRVTASTLNVRADANASAEVVTRVRRGTRLDVLEERQGWIRVRLASGEQGWVAAQHVSRGDAPAASTSRRRGGCLPDSDYSFTKMPTPSFSDRGAHGLVVVEASVNTKGDVTSTRIVSNGTGDESLAFLAEREIKSAKFQPPIRNCVPRAFIFTYKRSF
jgi:TonB family protein